MKEILIRTDRIRIISTQLLASNMTYLQSKVKIKRYHFLFLAAFLHLPFALKAQEFNCNIILNTEQLEGSSFDYVEDLVPQLENYINEYKWTEQDFLEEERIECQIQIVLNSANNQNYTFGAEAVFQAQRPIYNTTAKTTTILLSDDTWQFTYRQGQSLIHDELQFEPLTGFIDFFCYMILGYDFDSFAEHGGDPYFSKALNILNLAQGTSAVGWSRTTNNRRNRNILVTDLNSSNYSDLRTAFYQYHRLGLDQFVEKPEKARQKILEALKIIRDTQRRSTNTYLFDIFFDTKAREISAIFDAAETDLRLEAYNVLRETDQGHLSQYENLQN